MMNRQKKSLLIAGSIVLLLCLFTVLMIRVLVHPSEEMNFRQYHDELANYIVSCLDDENRQQFQEYLEEKLLQGSPMDDQGLIDCYIEYIRKHSCGIEMAEMTVLSDQKSALQVVNQEGRIEELCYNASNQDFYFFLPDWQEKEFSIGSTYTCLKKDQTLLLLLEQTSDECTLNRVWIKANGEVLTICYLGQEFSFSNSEEAKLQYWGYEDIADIAIKQGFVSDIKPYQNKIHGKLLSVKQNQDKLKIELEQETIVSADASIQVYNVIDSRQEAQVSDLTVGYDFTDFVLDDDGLCVGALIARKDKMENIRVVLKTEGYAEIYHPSVQITCDTDYDLVVGESIFEKKAGERIEAETEGEWFDKNRIKIIPKAYTGRVIVSSLVRSQGVPSYRGTMEIEKTQQGFLLVNELPLDEYLYSVVPSEMPASYPQEALAVQAVSARTYAYSHMKKSNMQKYGAHVDDSASFQVYNNMNENQATTMACRQTAGQIVCYQGKPATTYFYSTSCGYGTDMIAWSCQDSIREEDGYLAANYIAPISLEQSVSDNSSQTTDMTKEEAFSAFIRSAGEGCFEQEDSYFRWFYRTEWDEQLFWDNLSKRYEASPQNVLTKTEDGYESLPVSDEGKLLDIKIVRRARGGAVIELRIEGEHNTYKILTEKNVRYMMANKETVIRLGTGYDKTAGVNDMIPSAFFTMEPEKDETGKYVTGYQIYGGGFGHGIGMSQNGAKAMAKRGYTYQEILAFFYKGTELSNLNDI